MPVSSLVCGFHPSRQPRNIVIVDDEPEFGGFRCPQARQEFARLRNAQGVRHTMGENPDKTKLRYRTSRQFNIFSRCCPLHPVRHPRMEFMLQESKCNKSVDVEQVLHGNSARISRTCLLVNCGASGPALRTGSPVTGSVTIFAFAKRFLRGVKMTRPLRTSVSSKSPGRRSRARRIELGSTTCPLVESFVFIVRRSYHGCGKEASMCGPPTSADPPPSPPPPSRKHHPAPASNPRWPRRRSYRCPL